MKPEPDFSHFLSAQSPVYDRVRQELQAGRKRSHWMWFIFPQIAGLGHSPMAQKYALASLNDAKAYLTHPVLGPRLVECTLFVNEVQDRSATQILGSIDALKFRSCMTLFQSINGADDCFQNALDQYFDGISDQMTLDRI